MIYSLTPFRDELDLLEIRLAELDSVVDRHIIAEAPVTHSGMPKPLILRDQWERFAPWHDKIELVSVTDMPEGHAVRRLPTVPGEATDSDHWLREQHQRRALARGLPELHVKDVLFLSDLDEIPITEVFDSASVAARRGQVVIPRLAMHVYRMCWRWIDAQVPIARFFSPQTLWAHNGDLESVRQQTGYCFGPSRAPSLGWHLAYLGGVGAIKRKLASNAHRELDMPISTSLIRRSLASGADLFGRHRQVEIAPEEHLPPYVLAHRKKFAHLL